MRKLSKNRDMDSARRADQSLDTMSAEIDDSRPRRVQGAIITSRPSQGTIDLTALLSLRVTGASIAGSGSAGSGSAGYGSAGYGAAPAPGRARTRASDQTVSLSDGTQISFSTARPYAAADAD